MSNTLEHQAVKAPPICFMRLNAVLRATGLSRSTLYDQMAKGKFPQSFAITEGTVGWLESEVVAWQRDRIAGRDNAPEAA
jgi:prophage regulatory protein